MCGIAGILTEPGQHPRALETRVGRMAAALEHRGPDSRGEWVDEEAGIAFGHRRLAIVDLSATGHQPMVSSCGRMVISYNGEIYNADELRARLTRVGRRFRGTSDTEVLVEACAQWGVERATGATIGMFAYSLWDRAARCLYLARDRLGIKPLFYARIGDELLFGSELKAIVAGLDERPPIDTGALRAFMRHGYVPTPHCIFKGVSKLEPGVILRVPSRRTQEPLSYWSLGDIITRARDGARSAGDAERIEQLEDLLKDAVKRRMIADVPLGAFLSGGIDSSTVVALMQANSNRPVRTFSIGFAEAGYDEAKNAQRVARHLGTDHTELYVEPSRAFDIIPRLAEIYDEPFADSSQIPTLLVSELARRHVTVSLSGDGGDELFAGYPRYAVGARVFGGLDRMPLGLRRGVASCIRRLSPAAWDRIGAFIPGRLRPTLFGDKVHKLAGFISANRDEVYRRLVSLWEFPGDVVSGGSEPRGRLWESFRPEGLEHDVEWMQYLDTLTYLPDDILTKVDRASMAVSLEARVPLLDHRVVELAWGLPFRLKINRGVSKWILRQVLDRHVPRALVNRPKMGFGVPIDAWLRGPLRAWAEDLLAPTALSGAGLKPEMVTRRWQEHLRGAQSWHYPLWNVLMFQAWHRRWVGGGA